jgi:hypothetical protein
MVQAPTATNVTVAPETVQTAGVVEAKLTASPEEAVALRVNGALPSGWLASAPKVIVWATPTNPFCVTVICWPRTVMCATRKVDVFAVKEKLTTPFAMVPMVSQLWSLVGAKIPAREVVEGITGSSESDPAVAGSVKLAGPTKA